MLNKLFFFILKKIITYLDNQFFFTKFHHLKIIIKLLINNGLPIEINSMDLFH